MLAFLSGCAIGGDADDLTIESALSGTASISLVGSSVSVTHTSDSSWSLTKTGSLSGDTVSWNISATKTATVSGQLVIQGHMTVTNTGSGPATLGNILVNLQTRQGNTWVTRSTNIADATNGNDAVSAHIHKQASSEGKDTFAENAASGDLDFMDATNNTLFSLVPQVLIAPGETRALLFQASFDNTILDIAAGTSIRSEVIVSFGNATKNGNSTPNVDINGNGVIDSDEVHVRSVPARLTVVVPEQTAGNGTVTLSDTLDDIVATGTVSFSNVVINLGATSGTVTATVDGGVTGGTLTNCAHLSGASTTTNSGGFIFPVIDGVDLQACSTITVPGTTTPCTPGTVGCAWTPGVVYTYTQGNWGSSSHAASALLVTHFDSVYAATLGTLRVGIGFVMSFSGGSHVVTYLPASGTPGVLTSNIANPTTTSAGIFGGEVVGLRLNVNYADAGLLGGAVRIGDLFACTLPTDVSALSGMTVRQVLVEAERVLGASSALYAPAVLSPIVAELNASFVLGQPSTWAQAHLFRNGCP
jgi:hypothetical protein